MSSTTPGSDPERHDVDGDGTPDSTAARDDAATATTDPGGGTADEAPADTTRPDAAQAAVDPTAADADRVDRLEPAETPASDAAGAPVHDTAFTGTAAAERDADADTADRTELDAAVERARTEHPPVVVSSDPADRTDTTAMQREDLQAASPEPVRAEEVRRETGVPETIGAAGAGAGAAAASVAPAPAPPAPAPPSPQAIYVQAPAEPKPRGNRGFGVLVGLIATVAFGLLYAGISYLVILSQNPAPDAGRVLLQFLTQPVFWIPVVFFFLAFALLAVALNRAAWWTWAVFGLLAAVIVYFAYIGGALLTVAAWQFTPEEAGEFLSNQWLSPYAIVAAIIARELPIWFGGWIAARGRTVTERNRVAREEYERQLAAGPQPVSSTR